MTCEYCGYEEGHNRVCAQAKIEQLRAALQALHDWYVEYARINNLFNGDGSPATFHELLQARQLLDPHS